MTAIDNDTLASYSRFTMKGFQASSAQRVLVVLTSHKLNDLLHRHATTGRSTFGLDKK